MRDETLGSLLLVDDHGLVRHGLQLLIEEIHPGIQIRAASSLAQALEALATGGPFDLVALDLDLPDIQGLPTLQRIRADFPDSRVLVVSARDDTATIEGAMEAGALGFVSKATEPPVLRSALRNVFVHHRIQLPQTASAEGPGRDFQELAQLGMTPRQIEVLGLVALGMNTKQICRQLKLAIVTVQLHVTGALRVLDVPTRSAAMAKLAQLGYRFPPSEPSN